MQKLNNRFKKIIPTLLVIVGIELGIALIALVFVRIKMPTVLMSDSKALSYIMDMSKDERGEYINSMYADEKERLGDLVIAYYVAAAESGDTFDDVPEGENYDTSGKTYEDYVAEIETETESETESKETYPLSDGSGYVIYKDGKYTVYDNDGNEIDPETVTNEDGVIEMEFD